MPTAPGAVVLPPVVVQPPSPQPQIMTPPRVRYANRVGLLLPLSGPDRALGQSLLRAAQIALFDIAEREFELMPFDTKGTPDGARSAARGALDAGVSLILGPIFATSVREVAPLARAAGINVVAFSNNRSVAGNGVFLIGLLPREQIQRITSYARSQGIQRFATLVPDTPFGHQVLQDLREAVAASGGVLSQVEVYDPEEKDLSPAVRRLARYDLRRQTLNELRSALEISTDETSTREANSLEGVETMGAVGFDAVLLPIGGQRLKSIAAMLPFYDIDPKKVRLLGVASWRAPGIGREPSLVGAWFAAPDSKIRVEFERRYKKTFRAAPHNLAALAYDATALAALLARDDKENKFSVAELTSPNGFAGTAGIFRFLPSGVVQRGLAVMEVRPWRLKMISPSPPSFEKLTN